MPPLRLQAFYGNLYSLSLGLVLRSGTSQSSAAGLAYRDATARTGRSPGEDRVRYCVPGTAAEHDMRCWP